MSEYSFDQLVDLDRLRSLLQIQFKIVGISSAILDLEQNILVGEGWQDICTRFHRVQPGTCARCMESDAFINQRLHEITDNRLEYRCKNGLWDIAIPIIIDGRHLANFFTGQFFYNDDEADEAFFRAQAKEFGFDEKAYLAALKRVPIFTREQVRNFMDFCTDLVQVLAESGLKQLKLTQEVEEREKAEEELQRQRERLAEAQRIGGMGSWELDLVSEVLTWSDETYRIFEIDPASFSISYEVFLKAIHPEDRQRVNEAYTKSVKEHLPYDNEHRLRFPDGRVKYVRARGETCYDDEGRPIFSHGSVQDLTERKKIEHALQRTQFTLDKASDQVFWITPEGHFLYVNEATCEALGYSRPELEGLAIWDIDPLYSPEKFSDYLQQVKEKGLLRYETLHRARDGRTYPVEICGNYMNFDGEEYFCSFATDITERKKTERTLQRTQFTLDKASDQAFWITPEGRFFYVNEAACEALGYSRAELEGLAIWDIDPRFSPEKAVDCLLQVKEEGLLRFETLHRAKDGRTYPVEIRGNYMNFDGEDYYCSFATDITERKRVEQQLQQSLDFSEGVINAIPDLLFETDRAGRYLNIWTQKPELLAASKEVMLGKTTHDVLSPENAAIAMDGIREAEEKGLSFGNILSIDLPQGKTWFELSISRKPNSDPSDVRFLTLSRDVTERVRMEDELKENEARYRHSSNLLASILESAVSVGVYALDREYRYLSFNRRHRDGMKQLWDRDIAVGMSMLDAVANDECRELIRKGCDKVLTGHSGFTETKHLIKKDGREWYEYRDNYGSPIYNDDGEVVGLTLFSINITERKWMEDKLSESAQRYRDVFENVSDALYLLEVTQDGRFRYLEVNPALARFAGKPREDMIGRYLDTTLSRETARAMVDRYRHCVDIGTVLDEEIELNLPSGRRHFHSTLIPLRDDTGRIHRIAGISRDITERKRAEELLRTQAELETRLAKLAEISPGAVCSYQLLPNGTARIPYAAPRFAEVTGIQPKEVATDASSFAAVIHPDDLEAYLASVTISACTLRPWQNEFRIQHPIKGQVWIEGRSAPEYQADGSTIWYGMLHDITARKRRQAQEEIRLRIFEQLAQGGELTEILTLVVEYVERANPDFIGNIMLADAEGKYLQPVGSSNLTEDYLAAVKKVNIGEGIGSCGTAVWRGETVIAEDLRTHPFWLKYNSPALKAGLLSCWSEPISGAWGAMLGTVSIYQRKPGSPTSEDRELMHRACHLASIAIERKRALHLLHEREQVFRALAENAPDYIARYDSECRRIYINPAMQKLFELSDGEILGKRADELSPLPEPTVYMQMLREAWESGGEVHKELAIKTPQGEVRWADVRVVPEYGPDGTVASVLTIGRDIHALKEAERQLRSVVENIPDYIARWDKDCRYSYISPAWTRLFKLPAKAYLSKSPREVSLPGFSRVQAEEFSRALEMTLKQGKTLFLEDRWLGDMDVEIRLTPERDEAGTVCSVLGVARDITEEKRAEKALLESVHRYRSLFEESIDGAFLISREGKILDISKTGVRMFGYDSKEDMLSVDRARDLYSDAEERKTILAAAEKNGLHEHETLFKKKNGEMMLARCVITRAEGACDGTTIYQGVLRDVTIQKNLEQELFKAKKLEIVGQLAGGVAHEVRNPLNALLSISEALFLEKDIAENSEYKPYIHHIRTQVGRLSKLMTDLLELGKPIKAKNIHPTSLYQILTDTVNLWTTTDLTRLNQLTFTCDKHTPELLVTVDPTRLQQALLNLLDNASQHSIKNGPISLHIGAPVERRITISIRDAGKGIPPAKLEKVFDPFYTSRTGGTGLGLPLVKHIIESMEGTVKLFNNEPLPGCTAELELKIERRNKERP